MANKNLTNARKNKKDEFYTMLTDIEKELKHYKSQFKDKIVYCNCDDPEESEFWKFFELNFEEYGLKKLISTHYDAEKPTYKLELTGDHNGDGKVTSKDIVKTPLKQNGDFRSEESIELLKEADIVVTNPPFSLFLDYVQQLIKYNKNFIIMGNNNSCPALIEQFKNKKIRLGYSSNKTLEFRMPDTYESDTKDSFGNKIGKVPAISWFTSFNVNNKETLLLTKEYNNTLHPKCDNYNAIYIDRLQNMPYDYKDAMAVPITILKYLDKDYLINCEANGKTLKYKILGATSFSKNLTANLLLNNTSGTRISLNGNKKYSKILIQRN